jgi:hypothetical protein
MKNSPEETTHHTQAKALLHDIASAPVTAIPRRDTIIAWLETYLARTSEKGHITSDAEANDLIALDQFLRTYAVPVAGETAA